MSKTSDDKVDSIFNEIIADVTAEKVSGSFGRQFDYGISQGTQTLGNIFRVAKAGLDTATGEGSYSFNARLNEIGRQAEIDEEFPEYKNLKPEDKTGAMIAGEVGTAIVDPVTAIVPFLKPIAVAHKINTLASSAKVVSAYGATGAGEELLRQLGTEGELDGAGIATSAVFMGGTAGVIDKVVKYFTPVLAARAKASLAKNKEQEQLIDEMAAVGTAPKPVTQADNVRDWWKKSLEEQRKGNTLSPEEAVVVKEATSVNPKVTKASFEDLNFQERLVEISKIDKAIEKTQKRINSGAKKYNQAKLQETLKKQETYKAKLEENISEDMVKVFNDKADSTVDLLEDLADKGELTESIFNKVLMEVTRPTVGAAGGAIIGNMFDDDGDHSYMYWGIGLGAGAGKLQQRLQSSSSLSKLKNNGDLIISEAIKDTSKRMMAKLKYQTASTSATKMDAAGGWVQLIGNKLFSRIASGDVGTVEARTIIKQDEYFEKLASVIQSPTLKSVLERLQDMTEGTRIKISDEIFAINTVSGEVLRGLTDINNLSVGYKGLTGKLNPLSAEDIAEVKRAVPKLANLRDEHRKYVESAGISLKQDLGDDYGLPQLWDQELIGKGYQSFLQDLKKAVEMQKSNGGASFNIDNFASKVSGRAEFKEDYGKSIDTVFVKAPWSDKRIFRKTADFFENARKLNDTDAVRFMVQQGWIKVDAHEALAKYGHESTKVAEFSKTFGANGEIINLALNRIVKGYNKAANAAPIAQREMILNEGRAQAKLLTDGVEAFWGGLGSPQSQLASNSVRTLQALANMQYLTTVSIANLPDLLQPFINSNFGTAAKVAAGRFTKQKSFAQEGTFKYSNAWERELQNFLLGGQVTSRGSAFVVNSQDLFFKGVGLKAVTEASRNFAYDVGVNRVFNLAKKTKLSSSERKEIQTLLGKDVTPDNLTVIGKYKTAEEAFDSGDAKIFLDIGGRQSADRDAIIPLVGNRLLFTQSRNPYVRMTGQFLSWTMAKSAQLNKIISRVEDGDAQLALRMLAVVPVYSGLRELKSLVNPSASIDAYEDEDYVDKALKGIKISGQANNWAIDKIAEMLKYNLSSSRNLLGGIAPALGFLEESIKTMLLDVPAKTSKGDIAGAAKKVGSIVPLVSQGIEATEKVQEAFAVGGEVEVPNASPEPDERIDKMTGLPYNLQAGIPFRDEEDPLKRLGLVGGGKAVDPMQRLGFGLGGITKAATPFLKGLLKSADDTAENVFNSPAAKQLASQTPDGSVDNVAKSLQQAPVKNINKKMSTDQYIKEKVAIDKTETPDEWKAAAKQLVKDTREIEPLGRTPELEKSAQAFKADLITRGEHLENIDLYKPVTPFTRLTVEPSDKALVFSLKSDQMEEGFFVLDSKITDKFNVTQSPLSIGDFFQGRLDINAYNVYDTWIVAGTTKGVKGTHYAKAMHYIGEEGKPVTFTVSENPAEKILTGEKNKTTIAFIKGFIKDLDPIAIRKKANELLKNPEWTQIGFDPRRQTNFYIREGDMINTPVREADEVIQIGPLVLAKNVVLDMEYKGLAVGGLL